MRVFLTGATGLIGSRLAHELISANAEVRALSRRPPEAPMQTPGSGSLSWLGGDPCRPGRWMDAVDGCEAVVHLAGEPIARRRWSPSVKRRLIASRVESTKRIVEAIELAASRPKVLICASATGFYGSRGEGPLDESTPAGSDFLAKLCTEWESAACRAERQDVRVVRARIGVVLSSRGGALSRIARPFRFGLGGPIGPPRRWFPWVQDDDAIGLLRFALEQPVSGPLNVVSPGSVRMGEFSRCVARVLGRPARLRIPLPLLRLVLGEVATHLSPGQKVVPKLALEAGYRFRYARLEEALRACL